MTGHRLVSVVSEEIADAVGVRPDQRDGADVRRQRERLLVLQQRQGIPCNPIGKRSMVLAVDHVQRERGGGAIPLEQAEALLGLQDAQDRTIEDLLAEAARPNGFDQRRTEAIDEGELDVDPGLERLGGSVRLVLRHEMHPSQLVDGFVIGDDDAVEPPLLAKHLRQQLLRAGAGHAIQVVIGVHQAEHPRLPDGALERHHVHVAQFTWSDRHRRLVASAFRRAMPHKMLRRGADAVAQVLSLQAPDVSQSDR